MTQTSYTDRQRAILEAAEIHEAACRYRRQGLVCSTCGETRRRATRIMRLAVQQQAA